MLEDVGLTIVMGVPVLYVLATLAAGAFEQKPLQTAAGRRNGRRASESAALKPHA